MHGKRRMLASTARGQEVEVEVDLIAYRSDAERFRSSHGESVALEDRLEGGNNRSP